VELMIAQGRTAYLVPVNGSVTVNGVTAQARDGVAIQGEPTVTIVATEPTDVVVVEVAG
jgi:quercetin 2,3-dioxygenase